MNWLIFNVKQYLILNSYVATVTSQILVWLGRKVSYAVEASICYNTFSKCVSVWGRVLLSDGHKTNHRSRLIPKDDMRASLSNTVPKISDTVRRKKHKSQWVTDCWKLFVFFFLNNNLNMALNSFFQSFAPWFIDTPVRMKLFSEFQQPQRTTS